MKTQQLDKKKLKLISKTKTLALQLLANKQITRKLCRLILEADYNDDVYIKKLKALTEDLLRVKGYYHDSVRVQLADQCIEKWLKDNVQS